jgi:hypothetical protein
VSKYQGLQGLAGAITAIGWIAVIIGAIALFISLMSFLTSSASVFVLGALFGLIGGGQILLFGLLLAAAGGVINVVIDIEANTSGRTEVSNEQPQWTSDPATQSAPTSNAGPLPVPAGYVQVRENRVAIHEHVFHKNFGQGIVTGKGRDRYFVSVHFYSQADDAHAVEVEKYALYRRA